MRNLGIALCVIGVIVLLAGGIGYSQQTTILDVGGIKATATEHKSLPIAPIAGALALVSGIAILVASRVRRT